MKLIPLSDFVLEQLEIQQSTSEFKEVVRNYTHFLKQPLALGMFVPVNRDGVLLKPLQFCCSSSDCGCLGMPVNVSCQEEIDEYYEAKEEVLFEGFESTYNGFSIVSVDRIDVEDNYRLSFNKEGGCRQYYNIEELVMSDENFEIELTPSALEAIGIKE
ncbi:hypothetical protein [Chryseobacterium culicis]|uniref:hypothetical protein n=1 Tax=Chryseobacterium culicis TaxID=680127 RepID=UPI0018750810|nr:hypothetical protein [Chryseobacterium culicis]MBE4949889.1 hypothetical protein [Chryseobacterium culicis]